MPAGPSATASFFSWTKRRVGGAIFFVFALSAVVGCTEESPVVVELVPKDLSAEPLPFEPPVPKPKNDRMLAAIVPHGEQAFFFKVTGPKDAVADLKPAFLELVQSISFDDDRPRWTAPNGWTELPPSGIRMATLKAPGEPPLEVTVTSLPMQEDDRTGYLLENVNRWRGQMGLRPIKADKLHAGGDLDEESVEIKLADGTPVTLVNFVGHLEGGMTAPFAGGAQSAPPVARESVPPRKSPVSYKVPEGWQELGPEGISQASFLVGESKITVTPLPSSNTLIDNVNRWRGQVGLPPIEESQLGEAVESLTLGDGQPADYVLLVGPKEQQPHQAIQGVVAVRGEVAWFVKMIGDAGVVQRERQKFEAFAESLRFPNAGD